MTSKGKAPKTVDDLLDEIGKLEAKVRDGLQYESISRLLQKRNQFNQVCALLDLIGDSDWAISSVSTGEKRKLINPYFLAYGLLETMNGREVALRAIFKAFKIDAPRSLANTGVAVPRAKVISHALTSGGAPSVIVRNSMNENQFEYWTYFPNKTDMGNIVVYDDILRSHLEAVATSLRKLNSEMIKIENRRRARMSKQPLTSIFKGIDYATLCLVAAVVEEKYVPLIPANIAEIEKALKEFRAGLVVRMGEDRTAYHVDHVIEGLRLLRTFSGLGTKSETLRFRIVAEAIEMNLDVLAKMAHEIDETEKKRLRTRD